MPTASRELGAIIISLVKTGKFADTYIIPTGSTAHLPPIPPLFDSLIYKVFGLTYQGGYMRALTIIITGSVLFGMMPWLSKRLVTGMVAGMIGGVVCAIYGLGDTIWEILPGHGEYLTGLIMGVLLVVFLRRWEEKSGSWHGSLWLGLGIGAAFHVQPALLPVILGCLLFELWWQKTTRIWAHVGLILLGILIACLPWGWRNYRNFDAVFFIRSNLGHELQIGNNKESEATFEEMDAKNIQYRSPRASVLEAHKLIELGEIEYMRQARNEALAWIRANPEKFLVLAAKRFANFWIGPVYGSLEGALEVLALTILAIVGACLSFPKITVPQRAAILIPLITYPMFYYIVAYMPRYRIPVDWIILF